MGFTPNVESPGNILFYLKQSPGGLRWPQKRVFKEIWMETGLVDFASWGIT